MVWLCTIGGNGDESVMVHGVLPPHICCGSKTIVSPALAAFITARNEPTPELAVVVTTSTPVFETVNVFAPLVPPALVATVTFRAVTPACACTKNVAVIDVALTFLVVTWMPLPLTEIVVAFGMKCPLRVSLTDVPISPVGTLMDA